MKHNFVMLMLMLMCIGISLWAYSQIVPLAAATDLTHRYKNPSFSGIGTSAHYLTVENQERTRSDAIREKRVSDESKRQAALKNTNYAKFMKNLESRIYARFSKEMEDALFGELCGTTWDGAGTASSPSSAVTNNEVTTSGDCSGEVTFNGTTIKFTKDVSADEVILEIAGPDGNNTITMPLNDFKF